MSKSKRDQMRKAELEAAHHAEMGEHDEAAMAEATAEVLRKELVTEQTDKFGFPPPTDALEVRIADLAAKAAALDEQDKAITDQLVAAQIDGREADPGLVSQRREVREQARDLQDVLIVLRERLDEGKARYSEHLVVDWVTKIAASEARTATVRVEELRAMIEAKERELANLRLSAAAEYLRGNFFADAAHIVRVALRLAVPEMDRPASIGKELGWEANRSPLQMLLKNDDLAGAARAIPALLAPDDQAQVPGLAEAIGQLLVAKPPKSPDQINAERREAMDAPHRAELQRVDTWLREQVAAGPVPYETLKERAKAASIPIREPGPDGLGWGQAYLGAAAQRLGVGPFVRYDGQDQDELAAAAQFEEKVTYWALRGVPGLKADSEHTRTREMIHGMRS
jgi:hypothetical protein